MASSDSSAPRTPIILFDEWFPAIDGLVGKLADGARVADIGSGHGAATLLMAQAWPRSTFTGFDLDERAIAVARSRATAAGAPATVGFTVADAAGFGPGPYDVVTFFDALHDLGDPVAVLRRAHDLLTPGGIVVAVEPWSTDRLDDSIGNPIARLNYAISTSMCTPTSLAQPGAFGLGTSGGLDPPVGVAHRRGLRRRAGGRRHRPAPGADGPRGPVNASLMPAADPLFAGLDSAGPQRSGLVVRRPVTITLDPRENGPRRFANGGFGSGVLAGLVGGTATVTLRAPLPVGVPLDVRVTEVAST